MTYVVNFLMYEQENRDRIAALQNAVSPREDLAKKQLEEQQRQLAEQKRQVFVISFSLWFPDRGLQMEELQRQKALLAQQQQLLAQQQQLAALEEQKRQLQMLQQQKVRQNSQADTMHLNVVSFLASATATAAGALEAAARLFFW